MRRLLAKATPERSGDQLAGLCADGPVERLAAQIALADLPLKTFLAEELIPSEEDEVSDLIARRHDAAAFAPVSCLTVGAFREWLLSPAADAQALAALSPGLTPEMVAAVSKICRLQDLVAVAAKRPVVTRFRSTIGLPGRLATRNQPNHPTDSSEGILISALDGLLMGSGDAVIGVNPATDSLPDYIRIVELLETLRLRLDVPTQHCCLGHVTVAGQGSALSADAHWGVDQQTMEARAYAVAREFDPLLVNTVVGFIGPEYLYNGKQIIRAGLEDHFCGKLLGLPMGVDVCYTNHADADGEDMDALLTLLCAAGVNFVITVPGADDVMLNYQSLSHHDAVFARETLGRPPAPEFEAWLRDVRITDAQGRLTSATGELPPALAAATRLLPGRAA
ncbi:ethanolamine ammonia-lyase [Streptomyces purpurogeneiscleroticus]|nr:ethanolamine ammonia-lyase [Streptomyces purpurogeneiscleroticus]